MCLCEEIAKVKNASFPELRFVKVTGNYVPDCYFDDKKEGQAEIDDIHIINIMPWKTKPVAVGFAKIELLINLHEEKYRSEREAIIASSLAELIYSLGR